ncbi:LacI family DNA-binding transcriptional regulator [Schumannella soli]|nr:LacI family DNA-binding transcriptional regulator [Schumannella soli]
MTRREQDAMAQRVGIREVARQAGVSVTTVSHALNDRGQVSAATREHVKRIAVELGYAPNRIASALRSQRSRLIGFVSDEIAATPFSGRVITGAQDAASELGLMLMVVDSARDSGLEERQIDTLLAQQVDGVVYARMFHQLADVPATLGAHPTMLVDAVDRAGVQPSIVPDEVQIGRIATEHLIEAGHRRIAHLTLEQQGEARDGREAGFLATMRECGLSGPVIRVPGIGDAVAGRRAATELLRRHPEITAVLCFNDQVAMGVYQVAQAAGLRIPQQLSVVGVDDFWPISEGLDPVLTTVALPHYAMGRLAITRLEALISGQPDASPREARLACELVRRASVASPSTP